MKTIITYGTFDLFHIGHLRLLERAKALGESLIVCVSTDEFNAIKGKRSFMPYEHRAAIVAAIRGVDKVLPEHSWDQKLNDIKSLEVDIFCMGDDWKGKFDHLKDACQVVYLPRTEGIDSTSLRSLARAFDYDGLSRLKEARDIVDQLLTNFDFR